MNIVKLWHPQQVEDFGDGIKHLIKEYGDQAPAVTMDWIMERAPQKHYVAIVLTDSRWHVIAFGGMKTGVAASDDDVEAIIVDPNHRQFCDVHEAVRRNLTNMAWERRYSPV